MDQKQAKMDEISWQFFLIVIINMARLRFIILALPLTMILHKILTFSEPWYLHLLNECDIISFTRVIEGIERDHFAYICHKYGHVAF